MKAWDKFWKGFSKEPVVLLEKREFESTKIDLLLEEIYAEDNVLVFDRTIDVHIKNIRKKLGDDPKFPTYIQSVFGVGYKLIESWNWRSRAKY